MFSVVCYFLRGMKHPPPCYQVPVSPRKSHCVLGHSVINFASEREKTVPGVSDPCDTLRLGISADDRRLCEKLSRTGEFAGKQILSSGGGIIGAGSSATPVDTVVVHGDGSNPLGNASQLRAGMISTGIFGIFGSSSASQSRPIVRRPEQTLPPRRFSRAFDY